MVNRHQVLVMKNRRGINLGALDLQNGEADTVVIEKTVVLG